MKRQVMKRQVMKRTICFFLILCMMLTAFPMGNEVRGQNKTRKKTSDDIAVKVISVDESQIAAGEYYRGDVPLQNSDNVVGSDKLQLTTAIEGYDWSKYSSKYYYSKMSSGGKKMWKQMDSYFRKLMDGGSNFSKKDGRYVTKYFTGTKNSNETFFVWYAFVLSNPQYYFISNEAYIGSRSVACTIFPKYAKASARKKETDLLRVKLENWMDEIKDNSKAGYNRLRTTALLICDKIKYDYAALNKYEKLLWDQGIVSALKEQKTVCAGYAKLYGLIACGLGYEAITVPSPTHAWNNVKVGKTWYAVDTTWADQGLIEEGYLFVSNSTIKDQDHTPEVTFRKKVPKCSKNYKKSRSRFADIIKYKENSSSVTLSVNYDGCKIYYTLNGKLPTNKSTKYTGPIPTSKLKEGTVIKAIAYTGKAASRVWSFKYKSLSKPSIYTLKSKGSDIYISWKAISKASGYKLYRRIGKGEFQLLETIDSKNTTSFVDKDLVTGEKYSYYLVAFNNSGYESQKSHTATITKK